MPEKQRAPRNRTITLTDPDRRALRSQLVRAHELQPDARNLLVLGDCMSVAPELKPASVDLLFLDPPYNLNKKFGGERFHRRALDEYTDWLSGLLDAFLPLVKETGTVYICGDWHSSASIYPAAAGKLQVRNRITWEREKGRGARSNWKNSSEDIWYCTRGNEYTFNVESVKLRRKVLAPYRDGGGAPKDWRETENGNFRDTYPSNIWTDITIPFWSMPENTEHPAQKSEKLLAKLILASTNPGDLVLDPFLGSGTTAVVAGKLGRDYIGIEKVEEYALLAAYRLGLAAECNQIQGFSDGIFWERNTARMIGGEAGRGRKPAASRSGADNQKTLL